MSKSTGTLLLTVLLSLPAAAQEAPEEDGTEARRYTVEVIVFEYAEDVSVGTEIFVPEESPPESDAPARDELVFGDGVAQRAPDTVAAEPDDTETGPEFVLNTEDEYTMTDVESRLERLDAYRPVMHFAWTQTMRPQEETLPIDLPALGEPPDGLSGSFTLYLSRYLHLVVDLTLDERGAARDPVAIEDTGFVYGDRRAGMDDYERTAAPVRFRIREDRIFKSGDTRYFDHPKFGVLAKITRVDGDPGAVPQDADGASARELVGELGQ